MNAAERFPWATILPFEGMAPQIHETAFVAPGARIVGDVTIGPEASVWYNCVLRGDIHRIEVGARSNVQDGSVFHVEGPRPDTDGCPTIIGEDCVIGTGAMLAAGALLSPGKRIPPREIWIGRPAKFLRTQDEAQVEKIRFQTERYFRLAQRHMAALSGLGRGKTQA